MKLFNAVDSEGMFACLSTEVVHDTNESVRQVGKEAFRAFCLRMDSCYRERINRVDSDQHKIGKGAPEFEQHPFWDVDGINGFASACCMTARQCPSQPLCVKRQLRVGPATGEFALAAKIPVGRLSQASEIARGVAFIASDEAAFITGSTMSINGGQHMY